MARGGTDTLSNLYAYRLAAEQLQLRALRLSESVKVTSASHGHQQEHSQDDG